MLHVFGCERLNVDSCPACRLEQLDALQNPGLSKQEVKKALQHERARRRKKKAKKRAAQAEKEDDD